MDKNLEDLLSLEHPDAPDTEGTELSTDDWLKVLKKNPSVLQNPILVNGDAYLQVTSPSEILEFFGIDSAGLEKNPLGKEPTTSSTTEDEKFIEIQITPVKEKACKPFILPKRCKSNETPMFNLYYLDPIEKRYLTWTE